MDSRERDIRTGKLDERRAEERHKALKGARIIFNSGYGAMECLVRNQSEHGARLVFGDVAAVPNHFAIYVSGTQQRQNASVQWRYGDQVGIKVA
jgi:hypothetical protein